MNGQVGSTSGAIDRCQACEMRDLQTVLFVGYLPPVNRMRPIGAPLAEEPWFPAEMVYCGRCHLVQLGYVVDPKILFPPEYPYTSGTTRILRENFAELYREVTARLGLAPRDLVVDIGSNDGTLLENFAKGGHRVVGVEPSLTAQIAESRGVPTLMAFFSRETVERVVSEFGQPKLITACNVFAHIPRVHEVMENIGGLLAPDGVFVSESHYLLDLVNTVQYDTIYHEHLRYYSLTSLRALLEVHGFRIVYAKRIGTHGGSIRVYATRSRNFEADRVVARLLDEEREAGLASERWINGFRERVLRSKLELYELLAALKRKGARFHGIGAPSRASTLVNYVGLGDGILDAVLEVAGSKKVGHYMPGTKIPVLEESGLYADQPECVLMLSWHLAPDLCKALKGRGYHGDFIVPLPEPRVLAGRAVEAR